jgi:hypothetical protein
MGLFQEYMDSKGKIKKPKVDISGGDPDPKTPPTKPPKGGKPYMAGDKKKKGGKKGLGEEGDEEMKYQPSKDAKSKGHPPAKIPTVEQTEIAVFMTEAVDKDPTLIEKFVSELKQNGSLGMFIAEILQHRASYDYLAELMSHKEHGPEICARLARVMKSEEVAPPFPTAST